MTNQNTWLECARMAATRGHHAFACELYERAVSGPDGFEELRAKWGADKVGAAREALRLFGEAKINGINFIRNTIPATTLKDAKDLYEAVSAVGGGA